MSICKDNDQDDLKIDDHVSHSHLDLRKLTPHSQTLFTFIFKPLAIIFTQMNLIVESWYNRGIEIYHVVSIQ